MTRTMQNNGAKPMTINALTAAMSPTLKSCAANVERATCVQSRQLACTYLPRHRRESICDGCYEWRCCGTAQSPSTSTMPRRNHPTPSQTPEGTMLQEVPITHPKPQEDGVTTRPIPQKKIRCNQPTAGIGSMLSLHNQDVTGGTEISMLVMKDPILP